MRARFLLDAAMSYPPQAELASRINAAEVCRRVQSSSDMSRMRALAGAVSEHCILNSSAQSSSSESRAVHRRLFFCSLVNSGSAPPVTSECGSKRTGVGGREDDGGQGIHSSLPRHTQVCPWLSLQNSPRRPGARKMPEKSSSSEWSETERGGEGWRRPQPACWPGGGEGDRRCGCVRCCCCCCCCC